jgi:hypothetical protein
MSMKDFNGTICNRTRDLPVCSAVLQPTAPPRVPGTDLFTKMLWMPIQANTVNGFVAANQRIVLYNFGFSDIHFEYKLFHFWCLLTSSLSGSVVQRAHDSLETDSFYVIQSLFRHTLTQRFIRHYLEVFTYERPFVTAVPIGHTSSRWLLITTQEPVFDLIEVEPT